MNQPNTRKFLKRKSYIVVFVIISSGCGWNPFGAKEGYLRRGREFAQKGRFDDAAFQYRKALQKDSKYGEAYLLYGQLLANQNKPADAIANLSRAVEYMPKSSPAEVALGRAAVSELLKDSRRPPALHRAASDMASTLLSADPHSFEGLRLRGYLAVADSQPKEAIDYFRKTLAANPNLPDVATLLVQTLVVDNQGAEAEKVAKRALADFKTYGPLYDVLYSYYVASDRASDGEDLLRLKITNNPKSAFFVIELADHYWRRKNIPKMENTLRELSVNPSRYPGSGLEVGDFYRRIGYFDEAVRAYRAGLDPGRKKDYLERIVSARLAQGHTEEAAAVLENILKQYPDDVNALAARAELQMATGKPAEMRKAASQLADLVKKQPDNIEIRYNLGRAYRQLGQESEAQNIFRDVLQRDPSQRGALRDLADLAIHHQNADDALRYATRLLEIDPNNTGARLVRTSAWAINGRWAEVRAELRSITAANPELEEAWLQTATLDIETKKYIEAEQIFRRLYRPAEADARPLKGLVMLYLAQNQPQKALALAREGARQRNAPQFRILLETTAAQAGDLALALATAQKLSSDFPDNPDHLIFLGEIYQRMGQEGPAIAAFQAAQAKAPGNTILGLRLAGAMAEAGRFDEAVQTCRKNLKILPDDPTLINALAWYLVLDGKSLDEAASLAEHALQLQPANSSFLDTSGMIDLKARKLELAQKVFQQLVLRESHNPTYRTHLAQALIERGERDQARKELDTALLDRPSATQAETIQRLLKSIS